MTDTKTTYGLPGKQVRKSLALLGRGMAQEKRIYVLAIGSSSIFGALTVLLSRVLGWLTDSTLLPILAGTKPANAVWLGAGILFAVVVGLALSIAARRIFAAMGTFALQAKHREALSAQLVTLPPQWHRQNSTGRLLSNVSSDAEAATTVFNPLPYALGVVVMLGISAYALFSVDLWLALAAMAIIPLMIAANVVFQRYMTPAVTLAQELRGEVAEVAHESFEGATLVKAMGTQSIENDRFTEQTQRLRNANVRVGVVRAMFDPVIEALPNIGSLAVLLVGVVRASQGYLGPGDIVGAAYLLSLLAVPVRSFGWVLADLPRSVIGYDRVAQVVDTVSTITPGTQSLTQERHTPLSVTFDHVAYTVIEEDGPVTILDDVSFHIPPGDVIALMGKTGAGKTTAVSLIARLADSTSGQLLLGEQDVKTLSRQALSDSVAFVAQTAFIFDDTVRANITLEDSSSVRTANQSQYPDAQVWEALELAQIAEHVRGLDGGLEAKLGERGSNLSGGQRQRFSIARALIRKPQVLILDDATSALDPEVEQAILQGLRTVLKTTVIMVAYRAASAKMADSVVFLGDGQILAMGSHEQLLATSAPYSELALAYDRETAARAELAAQTGPSMTTQEGN